MRPIPRNGPRDWVDPSTPVEFSDSKYDLGRFRLEDLIIGDQTEGLWRAHDKLLRRTVAVRLVPATDPRQDALRTAACTAARVVDHRVSRVLDVLDHDGTLLIVTEWVDGISLEQILHDPMSTARSLVVARGIIEALVGIHAAGTTHGRLRPANVMVTDDGEVKLRGHCIDAQLHGVAPGDNPVAADIHGIGALLMACLTARWPGAPASALASPPIVGGKLATPSQLVADLPRDYNDYVVRALAAVPNSTTVDPGCEPFTSVLEARTAFSALGTPTPAAPQPAVHGPFLIGDPHEEVIRRNAGRRTLAVLAALGVIGTVSAVGFSLLMTNGSQGSASGTSARPAASASTAASLEPRLLEVTPTASAATVPSRYPIAGINIFDPFGAGIVRDTTSHLSIDDDVSTAWYTDTYRRQDFRKSKGIGLIVDLGQPALVKVIELGLVGNDPDLEIRTADTLSTTLSGYAPVSKLTGAPGQVTIREPRAITARYILIWFTGVPAATDGFRGGIRSVEIRND
ncbi:MAG: protein kinase family protein [Actinomycetes bacterium]